MERREIRRPIRYKDGDCDATNSNKSVNAYMIAFAFSVASKVNNSEPKSYEKVVTSSEVHLWKVSMKEEMDSFKKNNT